MTAHAVLSASSAHRWMNCPGSVLLEQEYPDSTSEFAAEGTLAHEICELKLRAYAIEPMGKTEYNSRLAKLKAAELYKPEMETSTDVYLEYIKAVMLSYPVQPAVVAEKRVDYSAYAPDGFGTADCLVLAGDVLHVIDYKHGKGVPVSADHNPQMMLYALGAVSAYSMLYSFKVVKMAIVQPRLGNISEFELPVDELIRWGTDTVAPAAKLALSGEGGYAAGEHCRFCRAKAECRARAEHYMQLKDTAEAWASSKSAIKASTCYTDEELAEYLKAGDMLESWYKDIKEHALALCLAGQDVPGYKAVAGRTSRSFTDTDKAFEVLMANGVDKAVLYQYVPLTLAKTEEAVGKKLFKALLADYVVQTPGKPTLVPASDKRARITNTASADNVFKKLED